MFNEDVLLLSIDIMVEEYFFSCWGIVDLVKRDKNATGHA